jgi:hypothetical protein
MCEIADIGAGCGLLIRDWSGRVSKTSRAGSWVVEARISVEIPESGNVFRGVESVFETGASDGWRCGESGC